MTKSTRLMGAFAAMAVALTTGAASATDVTVRDAAGGETASGAPNGLYLVPTGSQLRARTSGNASFHEIACGAFGFEKRAAGSSDPWEMFMTYCFEPDAQIEFAAHPANQTGVDYKRSDLANESGITASEVTQLQKLWANVLNESKTSQVKAAAFQAIIWELGQDNAYDLAGGTFALDLTTMDGFEADVKSQADAWYAMIPGWVDETLLDVLVRTSSQNLLIPREDTTTIIPLPTAGLLASVGLLGLASRRRRAIA